MKVVVMVLGVLTLMSFKVHAENYAQTIKNIPVNHLQLILNNLNIVFLTQIDKAEVDETSKEPKQKFLKFFESKSGALVADSFYQAPFSQVTREKCNELAEEGKAQMNGKLTSMIRMVSLYDMTEANALDLVNGMLVNVTIQAVENKDLSITCSK